MQISENTNPTEALETYAKSKGVPLYIACERAGIDFSTVARWRKKEPRTITIIKQIMAAIDAEADSRTSV